MLNRRVLVMEMHMRASRFNRMSLAALTGCLVIVSFHSLIGTIPASAESAGGAASPKDLMAKFQEAFSKKDVGNFKLLLYKPGLSKRAEESMVSVFQSDSCSGLAKNTRIISKDTYDDTLTRNGRKPKNGPIFRNGIAYDYPIPLYGYLLFSLTGKNGESNVASYPVGQDTDQRLFFIARVKVKQKAAD